MLSPSSIPWNKGRCVGPRTEFVPEQINRLVALLEADKNHRELALVTMAIDSMLRASDLLQLRVCDTFDFKGRAKTNFAIRQQKSARSVFPVLTRTTIAYIERWVASSDKKPQDFLFNSFRRGWTDKALSHSAYRQMIKGWALLLGLDPSTYSTHSLRRTKPIYLYQRGTPIEIISLLLGHKDTRSTMHYLGIDQRHAQSIALELDFFKPSPVTTASPVEYKLSNRQLTELAVMVVERIKGYRND